MNQYTEVKAYLYMLVSKYKIYFYSLGVLTVCAAILSIFVNYQIKELIDIITANPQKEIKTTISLFVFYELMHHGMHFIIRLLDIKYKPLILGKVVKDIYAKTMERSLHWFDSHMSGEISSKISDFQDSIITLINVIYGSLGQLVTIIISIIFLLTINYKVAGVLVTFIIIYVPILFLLLKKQMELQQKYVKARQEAVGIINDSIANIFSIKIIGNVLTEMKLKLSPAVKKWQFWDGYTGRYDAYYVDLTDTILITIMGGVQIWLIAYLYKNGEITAGGFAFVAMITLNIHHELGNLLDNILFSINPKIATIKSSYNFINNTADITDLENATLLPTIKGDIKFENVTFRYEQGNNIFQELNLHIKAGERVGIVGTSGAGKTTLIKCLMRYFYLQEGCILIDGYDISQVTEESLRSQIAVIPQDITMFHRSILENLQLAKNDANLDEIKAACTKARIHDDIENMPHGYDSIVGERGVKISGGQRQRIAIARAILKNAPILILDEATSALDTPTEILIQGSINEMLETTNATTIVIAHRLSTLLHMDRILIFDQGKIIENGTHIELLALNGLYKTMWETQASGFLPTKKI